ncbi:MAG TPA: acyl-CoA thioesterase II [Anaeromyxobacter sp.]
MDEATLAAVIRQLDLAPLGDDRFRGDSRDTGAPSLYGGQVVAQALIAAERTVEGRVPHSLHAYFLLPGDAAAPVEYRVERTRDGGSFSARRVVALQGDRSIFVVMVSLQAPEDGLEHAAAMPEVPPPEALPSFAELRERWLVEAGDEVDPRVASVLRAGRAFEFRPVDPMNPLRPSPREPRQASWFRAAGPVPDDPRIHRALLAYASDTALAGTPLRPHGLAWPRTRLASIDHALWFHRPARVDGWLLHAMDSPSAQGGRGLARGLVFDRGGALVASVAQEALFRDPAPREPRGRR